MKNLQWSAGLSNPALLLHGASQLVQKVYTHCLFMLWHSFKRNQCFYPPFLAFPKSLLCGSPEYDSPQKGEIEFVPPTSLRNAILTRLLPNRRHHLLGQLGFNRNQWE